MRGLERGRNFIGRSLALENAWPGHIHWLSLSLVEAFSAGLVICGILFDRDKEEP